MSSASNTPVSAPFNVPVSPATAVEVTGVTGGNRVSAKLNLGGQQEYGRLAVKAEKKEGFCCNFRNSRFQMIRAIGIYLYESNAGSKLWH